MSRNLDHVEARRLWTAITRHGRWILVPMVIVTALSAAVSLTQQKQYDVTVILLAGQGEGIADVTAIDAITKATQTLARMGTNRVVIEQALKDLKLDDELQAVQVAQNVRSSVPVNTQQIELTVRDVDPDRAALLANGIGSAFSKMVEDNASEGSNLSATVWQPALKPSAPAKPNVPLNIVLGLLLGVLVGLAAALLVEQLDQAWRSEEELEDALGVPVLASIPDVGTRPARQKVYA